MTLVADEASRFRQMSGDRILAEALHHAPVLLAVWAALYLVYWLIGLASWPAARWRERALDRVATIDLRTVGAARLPGLALISVVSLFLELLLIRWVASEIRVFAYFKSLVLIGCFLGFGLGCYLTRERVRLASTLVPLLGMVWVIEMPWAPLRRLVTNLSGFIGWFSDVHIWSRAYFLDNAFWGAISAAVAMSIIIPLFGLIVIAFVPLGQLVGWYLEHSSRGILAYSVNVAASVVGIWLYTTLSFLSTPPMIWFGLAGLGLLAFVRRLPGPRRAVLISFTAILALFGVGTYKAQWWGEESWKGSRPAEHQMEAGPAQTVWSPYQKLTLVPLHKDSRITRYVVNTNDSWFQQVLDLSPEAVRRHPELYDGAPLRFQQYNLPYQFYPNPRRVLIAGAGMGNDVAAALRNGAEHVTAVEIDPLIYAKGKELHFERPYSSPRVTVRVDDARSFIQHTRETFDLIVFSILDSHTTSSHYTNIRLDNYVYTVEAMQTTRRLLNPDGLFVMSFSSERPWFTGRLRDVVTRAFGRPPLMTHPNELFFVVGPGDRVERTLAADPELRRFVERHSDVRVAEAAVTTDDWPYLYQQYRGIPLIVWLLSGALVGLNWAAFRRLKGSGTGMQWHFFWLGAAFMLLEVQIISRSALLFGTTWLVNSIVISILLACILLSNVIVALLPAFPRWVAYAGLFGALALGYLMRGEWLFSESMTIRAAVAGALYCSPVLFAGLVFIASFREVGFRAEALGSNLLGALVGGLLESLSYLVGIRALLVVAGGLYALSAWTDGIGRAEGPGAS